MRVRFSDYDGPTGLVIATGYAVLPLASPNGARAFVVAAAQSGTTVPLSRFGSPPSEDAGA